MANFPSTQWSLIRRSGDTPSQRHAAFGQLALEYRRAILGFFRARLSAADAEDATQSFLLLSYEHAWWSRANAETGSFRGFLLLLLHRHLGHLRAGARLPIEEAESVDSLVDAAPSPDRQFDTHFALIQTSRALDALRRRYRERERGALFEHLLPLLSAPPEHGEMRKIAERVGVPANTLTIELKRLRARLRDQLRVELRDLCADESAFEAEWLLLQQLLSGA